MADQLLFDKLAYIDRLKRAGIDEGQARAHAEAMDEALRETVATQPFVKAENTKLETFVTTEITRLETFVRTENAKLETFVRTENAKLETFVRTETTRLENKIDLAVRDMTIRMGAIAVVLFGALASIKFLG